MQTLLLTFNFVRCKYPRPVVSLSLGQRVSQKLRPQTRKTQTLGCLENSDLEKTQTRKTQTLGCLENSDPKNSDPLGVSKTQTRKIKHIYTAWMPQVDLFTVHWYSGISTICREKKKQLAVLDTCNDHENYTQHSYRFFWGLSFQGLSFRDTPRSK